jgi:hypothetical protein
MIIIVLQKKKGIESWQAEPSIFVCVSVLSYLSGQGAEEIEKG